MSIEERIAYERVLALAEAAWRTMQLATEAARNAGLDGLHVATLESVGWAAVKELNEYIRRKGGG